MKLSTPLWYLRRLSRMSVPEVAHRFRERGRIWADARARFGWEQYGDFEGPILGLPGLHWSKAPPALLDHAQAEAQNLRQGRLEWLGQQWPVMPMREWGQGFWLLDPKTGELWPGAGCFHAAVSHRHREHLGDVKFVWEPNKLQMLQTLAVCAAAGDARAVEDGFHVLRSWMAVNPPYDGVNWTSGIEAASRVVSVLTFLSALGPLTTEQDETARRFLHAHAAALHRYPSLYSSANNHRLAELVGLLLLAVCAPELAIVPSRRSLLQNEFEKVALSLFHEDGTGAEQATAYAAYTLEWTMVAVASLRAAGLTVGEAVLDRIDKVGAFIEAVSDEAGRSPAIGDDDEARVLSVDKRESDYALSVAALAARMAGRPLKAHRLPEPALRDWLSPEVADLAPLPSGVTTFKRGGYTVGRFQLSAGQAVLLFDHGPLGFGSIAAHGHADALAVWLHWGDEPVFVDAGTYLYHAGGDLRDRLRGTQAHNTLCLGGEDQSRIIGPFAWAEHVCAELVEGESAEHVAARHSGYRRRFGLVHERRLTLNGEEGFTIEDVLTGVARGDVAWSSGLTLAPWCRVNRGGDVIEVCTPAGRKLQVDVEADRVELLETSVSERFNAITQTTRLNAAGALGAGGHRRRVCKFTVRFQ